MKTKSAAGLPVELLERSAQVLRLLAHPQRLRIIALLRQARRAPVHAVMAGTGLPQAAASQHLNQMKRVGLLRSERRGKEVWYAVADERSLRILDCIQCHGGAR